VGLRLQRDKTGGKPAGFIKIREIGPVRFLHFPKIDLLKFRNLKKNQKIIKKLESLRRIVVKNLTKIMNIAWSKNSKEKMKKKNSHLACLLILASLHVCLPMKKNCSVFEEE
jgi:hypothetical protein